MEEDSIFPAFVEAHYNARYGRAKRARDRQANAARKAAHKWFDRIWRQGYMRRSEAYFWLALQLGIPVDDCHMGMMSNSECHRVIEVAKRYLEEKERRPPSPFSDPGRQARRKRT